MQLTKLPSPAQFPAVIGAMHDDRIERYLPAAGGSQEYAFSLYLWNCALCEAFYLPLHVAEVTCRNAIHARLLNRLGEQWFDADLFHNIVSDRHGSDLNDVIDDERRVHGVLMTSHHLVSSLSFGFWQHLLTRRFERLLWPRGMKDFFPNLPNSMGRSEMYDRVEIVRKWRNRIAHHRAIFDQGPTKRYQETLQLVRWVSHDVSDWLTASSRVSAAIAIRPAQPE